MGRRLKSIDNGDEFYFTYMIATSPLYISLEAEEYGCPEKCIIICGEPMVDRIFSPRKKYEYGEFEHMVLWVPTFRKSDYLGYDDSNYDSILPLFDNNDYEQLNEHLQEYNILLVVKIHPCQIINSKLKDYSNIRIYSHKRFVDEGLNLYDMMASSDALLGDYSSASLQYLLVDKPIAYIIPDLDDYKKMRGFVFDDPMYYMPGEIIKQKDELWAFLSDLSNGKDDYADRRRSIKDIIHYYQDGKSCERLIRLSGIRE